MIINRIKKLKAHAESAKQIGSLEEAESFMTKVVELLQEYNISMMEVDSAKEQEQDPFKNWKYAEDISYEDKHQGWKWKLMLMGVITDFNFTGFTYREWSKTIRVYGNMENVDVTVWLYHYLEIGLFNLAEKKYQEELKIKRARDKDEANYFSRREAYTFKRDFLLGAVDGFRAQLEEKQRKQAANVTAVVVYNAKQLREFVKKTTPNLKKGRSLEVKNVGASYHAGYDAGKNFNVNKPLSSNKSNKRIS